MSQLCVCVCVHMCVCAHVCVCPVTTHKFVLCLCTHTCGADFRVKTVHGPIPCTRIELPAHGYRSICTYELCQVDVKWTWEEVQLQLMH